MNDYNYMHPSGKTVIRLSSLISVAVFIIILAIVSVVNQAWLHLISSKMMFWIWIVGTVIILIILIMGCLIIPIYRYKIFRYKLVNQEVTVRNGLWFINVVNIPLFRIQNVDTHEGIIMRKYNLTSLTLSTAGGNTEIKLIDKNKAYALKQAIKNSNNSMQ
ncbi:PH domain-containing protein [Staphylococcus nepalensis]|uniref:Membrane spanning protein n=1 Tax=Staphylococcus nepalensis TaxID=214473 RepID=A0A2T4S8E4_9STAP|nr:PH domain-containing protein [Staphylococcus nepalensis]VDG66590.1 membrane flanked domain-containing protein [Lacrimispora indolis]PNZ97665.1 hypothetical protein CD130_07695 [Staphylococcus nepalensis]PTK58004.1 hypothetical protein BUZ61_11045 [Staphylococcus nepalensis]SUM54630.1 membrane spanning protein [Staphylococcus nepalensis]GGB94352.1 membrane protein [Staphylococcus nepalensis]